jgi:hypothetical protein
MPDQKPTDPASRTADPAPRNRPPVVLLAGVAVVMVLEAVGVYALVSMTGKAPKLSAAAVHEGDLAHDQAPVEILLVEDAFQNMSTNRVWLWQTQVYLKVPAQHETYVSEQLRKRKAEIVEGVALIIRRAQHAQLREPELKTITRQLTAYVNSVFGQDDRGEDRVSRVVIATFRGQPVDY